MNNGVFIIPISRKSIMKWNFAIDHDEIDLTFIVSSKTDNRSRGCTNGPLEFPAYTAR